MKKRFIMLAVLFCLVLSGCTNTYYTKEQEENTVAAGEAVIREYLDRNYTDYTLERCYMGTGAIVDGNIFAGYYASDCVEGYFTADGKQYKIAVNIKTGDVYTDEQKEALYAYVTKQIGTYLADAGYEAPVVVAYIQPDYKIISKDVRSGRKTLDTEAHLQDVFPVKYSSGNFDELLSEEKKDGEYTQMTLLFHEDETGIFPNDAVKRFCEETAFFQNGEIRICNLRKEDFDDILAGVKKYHYMMEKSEEYSIFPENVKTEESRE